MNISTSEHSSSGCESGWTTYLDQLSNSTHDHYNSRGFYTNCEEKGRFSYMNHQSKEEDEDEDLSMVSDASSGPPHYASFSQEKNKSKIKEAIWPKKQSLCLDDTASSPVYTFSQKNVPPKHDHDDSEEAFPEGESITKKHLGFFKSSKKGKSVSLLGRKRQ